MTSPTLTTPYLTSPTLYNPTLGTPASGNLNSCTGLPIDAGTTGTLPASRGGTGLTSLSANIPGFLADASSTNLLAAVTDETGTGVLVFNTSPTFVTPILGTPTSGDLTNCVNLPVTTGISGLGTGIATFLATPSSTNLATAVTDETGSGALVFGTGPTLSGPTLDGAVLAVIQSVSGAGAVNVTSPTTAFTSTATGNALTLANGTAGQIKTIVYVAEAAAADTGVLTPTTPLGYATITFTNVGDSVTLQYFTQGWAVIGVRGATVA